MLSDKELERYARHIVLREVGGPGQAALKEASVLVIGAGGLGAPALMYLAAAGVGTLGVVDDDKVSLSNLQRQIIHTTPEVGRLKVDSAAEQIRALNPHVLFESHAVRLNAANAMSIIGGYDLVLDGSDNFETRYLVSDACYLAGVPLITASLGTFDGSLTTIRAHEKNADGEFNPTYRCLFPEPPPSGTVPTCEEAGVPHPTIVSESGRAVVAYHSMLIFDVLGVSDFDRFQVPPELPSDAPQQVNDLFSIHRDLKQKNLLESYHDAVQAVDEALDLFNLGGMTIEMRAPLMSRICLSGSDVISMPSKARRSARTTPGGRINLRIERPVIDLPEPLSPTMPNRSRSSVKETPFTTSSGPLAVGKVTLSFLTSSSALNAVLHAWGRARRASRRRGSRSRG